MERVGLGQVRPYPFPEVTGPGRLNDRMNGVRFADWSIGRFFEQASKETYFRSAEGALMPTGKDQPPPDLRYFPQAHR